MKKILLSLVLITSIGYTYADITGNGYYRVQNYGTSRWASLVDDKGSVDFISAQADLHALQLSSNTDEVLSDPASIIYLSNIEGYKYNVATQGTSLQSLVDQPIFIRESGSANGSKYYRIWGEYKNVVKYISDGEVSKLEYGSATINDNNKIPNLNNWFFIPVDVNTDNYFGVVPSLDIDGELYCSLYTSFPFKAYSSGVKIFYVHRTGNGMAEIIEMTDVVPASTPVLIKCVGRNAGDNKLEIVNSSSSAISNSLHGVYFNYSYGGITNHLAYDPATMRILGKCSDGSLGFVTPNLDYIPANTAYLKVNQGSPMEFKCVSSEDFDNNFSASILKVESSDTALSYKDGVVFGNPGCTIEVINLAGEVVMSSEAGYADVSNLAKGVYIAVSNGHSIKFIR